MSGFRERGEEIRRFIIINVEKNPLSIARLTIDSFNISKQAVSKHLQRLCDDGIISYTGTTRNRTYSLVETKWFNTYNIDDNLEEDVIWRRDIRELVSSFPENVVGLWSYGFSEMFNNAIDHSSGTQISIHLRKTKLSTEMLIMDNGIGIFKKIQSELQLLDERHAILELSKGKLTTDPTKHSGEGIFFTSRMFDSFDILSGGTFFTHKFGEKEDWILEISKNQSGTSVWMKLANQSGRTTKEIFDTYSSGEDYGFNNTVVPVTLARYGKDQLVSRSQAKRLLARIELFKQVVFDFSGVESIGQAFADEIFRVFALNHEGIELTAIHTNEDVQNMINRAKSHLISV